MFDKNKFADFESKGLLMSIQASARLGRSVPQAIELIYDTERTGSKTKNLLRKVLNDITNENTDPATALAKVGALVGVESFILRSSGKVQTAIKNILELREIRSIFEKTILKIFIVPTLMVIASFIVVISVRPKLIDATDFATKLVKNVKSIDITTQIEYPWWYENIAFAWTGLAIVLAIVGGIIFYYWYNINNNPKVIYKSRIFGLKSYDDVFLYFKLIASLRESGMTGYQMADILFQNVQNLGWKKIFRQMRHDINSSSNSSQSSIARIFEDVGVPKDIVINLKSSEISGDLWSVFGDLADYSQEKSKENALKITAILKFPILMTGYLTMLYMLGSVFYYGISLMLVMQTSLM